MKSGDDEPSGMETSCGLVLVNLDSILLLQYPQGHWGFPKGHVEADDPSMEATAMRELAEETGIKDVRIVPGWSERTEYTFTKSGRKVAKQVHWFLAETSRFEVRLSHEHTNHLWLTWEEAAEQITFAAEVRVLASARKRHDSLGSR